MLTFAFDPQSAADVAESRMLVSAFKLAAIITTSGLPGSANTAAISSSVDAYDRPKTLLSRLKARLTPTSAKSLSVLVTLSCTTLRFT